MDAIWARLDTAELEPAPKRRGDRALVASAAELAEVLERAAIARLDELRAEVLDREQLGSYELSIAYCAAAIAGLRFLGGATSEAAAELKAAADLAPDGELGDLLREGALDPEAFTGLLHAQWLMRNQRFAAGRSRASELLRRKLGKEMARCAQQIADTLEPLGVAPTLFRFNGCGVALYGRRDARDDGSYVATRYVALLFIPVYPLDAFRVTPANFGFRFHGKAQLDPRAHWIRRLAVAVALAVAVVAGGAFYLKSDRHQLNQRLADAAKLEGLVHDQKSSDAALERYEQIFHEYREKVDEPRLEPIALGIARISTRTLGAALRPGDVDVALAALRRFASVPEAARGGEAAAFVEGRVNDWVNSLGSADAERTTGSLRLLGITNIALNSPPRLAQREQALHLRLGQDLAADWPVVALEFLARAADEKGAPAAMETALAALPPTALDTLSPVLEDWITGHVGAPAFAKSSALLDAVRVRAEARKADPARTELLDKGGDDALEGAIVARADDPAFSVALAQRLQERGEAAQALATLERLGTPGQLPESAALLFGRLSSELGNKQRAVEIYEHWLLARLPEYEATSFKLSRRVSAKRQECSKQADQDALPSDITKQLQEAKDTEQARSLYGDWVDAQLKKDSEIEQLRGRLEKLDAVVPVALSLGMLLLDSAQTGAGELRAAALAKAERTFLSIEAGGEGLPAYHLGLGSVYYRLGKSTEGEREFAVLLERKEPLLDLDVVRSYRDLGQLPRAKEVALRVFEQSKDELKFAAAVQLSLLAEDLEEQEKWLLAGDQSTSYVKNSLVEVQAKKAFRAGNLALADEKYQRAYELYLNESTSDVSGANNAALALSARYTCTGDSRHLTRAVDLLEKARRLAPNDSVVLQNLATPLRHLAELDAVHTWLNAPALKLSTGELESVLEWLDAGDARATVLTTLRQNPYFRRAADTVRQARVLGPSWPEPYYSELQWLTIFEDADGIATIKKQIEAAEKIDRESAQRQRAEWVSGVNDARERQRFEGAIARYAAILATLEAPSAAPSRAVVKALWADQEDSLTLLDSAPAHAQKALSLLRQAEGDWPLLSLQGEEAAQLTRLAVLRALPQAGPDARHDLRRDGITLTLWRWLKATNSPALAAVKAQPELAEAARALATAPDRRQSPLSYVLGMLTGDRELVRRARQQITLPHHIPALEADVLLSGDAVDQARLEMVREMARTPS
jgi:cellulose synthase operon protein C